MRHLDSVRMTQLMGREPSSHTRFRCRAPQLLAAPTMAPSAGQLSRRGSRTTAHQSAADDARASHECNCDHAQRSIPTSRRRPPLPRRTSTAPRVASRSVSARSSASPIRRPDRHKITISARRRIPSALPPASRVTAMISSTVGGSAGIPPTLVPRSATLVKPGHRRLVTDDDQPRHTGQIASSPPRGACDRTGQSSISRQQRNAPPASH